MKVHLLDSLPSGMILRIHTEEATDEGADSTNLQTFAVIFDPAGEPPIALWLSEEDLLQLTRSLNIFLDKPLELRHSDDADD